MAGVFISHSSEDKSFVLRLAADLAIAGVPVWLDSWELGPGDSLMEKIQTGVTISSFVIVVVSPASLKSKWVRQELKAGLLKEAKTKQVWLFQFKLASHRFRWLFAAGSIPTLRIRTVRLLSGC
jgi:hypothetical protein